MTEGNHGQQAAPESFEQHEQYAQALELKASGKDAAAVEALQELVEVYPDDERLGELLLRWQLDLGLPKPPPKPASPLLQYLLIGLIIITAGLGIVAGLLAATEKLVDPTATAVQQRQEIATLEREINQLLTAEDYGQAGEKVDTLAQRDPNNPLIEEARQRITEGRALDERYLTGVDAQQAGNREAALAIFQALEGDHPEFRDVRERIAAIQEALYRDDLWADAQAAVAARNWPQAIEFLEEVRGIDPAHRDDAQQQLYEIYKLQGTEEIDRAGGDLDRLRQAATYLRKALQLMPSDQVLARLKALAEDYVAGFEALDKQDYVTALQRWEKAYRVQRDFGDGQLGERLEELYPQAAQQLISEANGKTEPLEQALVYLDRAIADRPEDEGLLNERHLLDEYLKGVATFRQGYWDLTITRWGPIYEERPDYQNGVLKEELTDACGNSDDPDPAYCPP